MSEQQPGRSPRVSGARVTRVAPLVGLAGRTAGEAVVESLRNRRRDDQQTQQARVDFHTRTADHWARRLGRSRGVLMKAGQILSVVMPDSAVADDYRGIYQAAFAKLQDDAPPMPPQVVVDVITAELGRPPAQVFATFDLVPIAAASIGQVHTATLPDGRRVAVKVQYPGVDEAIRADLANTQLLATFLDLLFTMAPGLSRLDVDQMAREVATRISEEIDYRAEASHQHRFAHTYRGHPFIRVPDVVPDLSGRTVLTTAFVDGMRYAKAAAAEQHLRDRWGEVIFRFAQDSMYRLGLINTDPHPGNFLFHPDGTVSFLDFGCVKHLPTALTHTLAGFLQHAVDSDTDELYRSMVAAGWITRPHPPAPAAVQQWWNDGWRYLTAPQPFTFTPAYVADVMHNRLSAGSAVGTVNRKLALPGELTMAVRMDTGVTAVLGGLRARGPWNAIREEHTRGGPPATAYGEQHIRYLQATP